MKKSISLFLCLVILFCSTVGFAVSDLSADEVEASVGSYMYNRVENPQVGSVGGEWAIVGLARSGLDIPTEYYDKYLANVAKYVKNCRGVLSNTKYTEYSRLILALTSIGVNPENIDGYNLVEPLGDFEKTVNQGINGAVWALIALDCGDYEISNINNANEYNLRQLYVNYILENQLEDGGWALTGNVSDVDITAMAITALSNYCDDNTVKDAVNKALNCVSQKQNDDGGFSSGGDENSESVAQVLIALCKMGVSIEDSRFVKNGNTVFDNLISYYTTDGGFKHLKGDIKANQMATEQCFCAIVALNRALNGKKTIYDISDTDKNYNEVTEVGLPDRNNDVKKCEVVNGGKTFLDITEDRNKKQIEELASRNIINGKDENNFDPSATMTRAEFAAIITRALGLKVTYVSVFNDVSDRDWFFDYVGTAYNYKIVQGVSASEFNPNGTITREEAAVMVARAARLCGVDTEVDDVAVRDILAEFMDYIKVSDWAMESFAFSYRDGILSKDELYINPGENISRSEIAYMVYNMLNCARLI